MLALKVRKDRAQEVKKYLAGHKLMVINYRIVSSGKFIYFPIGTRKGVAKGFLTQNGAEVVNAKFERLEPQKSYRQMLQRKLGKGYAEASRGYDVIGDIAVIDSADDMAGARKTAQVIMSLNKNVQDGSCKGRACERSLQDKEIQVHSRKEEIRNTIQGKRMRIQV